MTGRLVALGVMSLLVGATPASAQSGKPLIPVPFHGHWEADLRYCDEPTENILRISASEMRWYEESGFVQAVRNTGPRAIDVTVYIPPYGDGGAKGETSIDHYTLSGDGQTLIWSNDKHSFKRVRCPD